MIDIIHKEDGDWIRFKSPTGSEALINLDHRGPIVQKVVRESVAAANAAREKAEAERDEAQGALCRARDAMERVDLRYLEHAASTEKPIPEPIQLALRDLHDVRLGTIDDPCPHAEREKALEEAGGWLCSHPVVKGTTVIVGDGWLTLEEEYRRRASAEGEGK